MVPQEPQGGASHTGDEGSLPATSARLQRRIEAAFRDLSPNDRRIADYLLAAYPNASWETVEEVATQAGVSKAAVVRFASRLGFQGFTELQRELQAEFSELFASPLSILEQRGTGADGALLDGLLEQTIRSLQRTRDLVSDELPAVAQRVADCRGSVYVIGLRRSFGLALYAHYLLTQVRPNVILMRPDMAVIPEGLADMGTDDIVLAITVRRYAQTTLRALEVCKDAGAYVAAISDTFAGPVTPRSDIVLAAATSAISHFHSMSSVVFVIEALVNAVLGQSRSPATKRLDQMENLGAKFSLFEDSTPEEGHA